MSLTLSELSRYVPGLETVPSALQDRLLAATRPLEAGVGTFLFRAGDPCSHLAVLAAGRVRVSAAAASGREVLLYRVHPGELCTITMSCLLGEVSYPADGVVEKAIRAILFPRSLFLELYDQLAGFRSACHRLFAGRLVDLMTLVAMLAFATTSQRLAAVLSRRGPRVHATHEQLAAELGTSREVVTRALKQLEEAQLVRTHRGWVEVLDSEGLLRRVDGLW